MHLLHIVASLSLTKTSTLTSTSTRGNHSDQLGPRDHNTSDDSRHSTRLIADHFHVTETWRGMKEMSSTSTDFLPMSQFPFRSANAAGHPHDDSARKMILKTSDTTIAAHAVASARIIAKWKCIERRAECEGVRV